LTNVNHIYCELLIMNTKINKGALFLLSILISLQAYTQMWYQSSLLRDINSNPADYFGQSVDISGDYLIVGTAHAGSGGFGDHYWDNRPGAAYIFKKDSTGQWHKTQKFTAFDGNSECYFGFSVAIKDNYAFVGSPKNDFDSYGYNQMMNAGAVYVFIRDSGEVWHLSRKIIPNDRHTSDLFGHSIDIQNNTLYVGAIQADYGNSSNPLHQNTGAIYTFKLHSNGNWIQHQKIFAPDKSAGDGFGYSLDVNKDKLIIGAALWENEFQGGTNLGAAYFYLKDSLGYWVYSQTIHANHPTNGDLFGSSVSISSNHAVIGAEEKNYYDSLQSKWIDKAGAAYIFETDSLNHWYQAKKIVHPTPVHYHYFAKSVVATDHQIFIGNPYDFTDSNDVNFYSYAGSIRVFQKDPQGEWNQVRKICKTPLKYGDYFGYSIAVDSNQLITGLPGYGIIDSITGYNIDLLGAAMVFQTTKPITSINNKELLDFSYFPNPVSNKLNIVFRTQQKYITINQYNSIGELINSKKYNSCNKINIEVIGKPGIYFIEAISNKRNTRIIKIIKL